MLQAQFRFHFQQLVLYLFLYSRVDQKLSGQETGYSINEARQIMEEMQTIQNNLTSGQQEKQDLMQVQFFKSLTLFSSPGRSSGRAVVLPLAYMRWKMLNLLIVLYLRAFKEKSFITSGPDLFSNNKQLSFMLPYMGVM